MKKVLSFLAVVFAVVMLAACGKKYDVTFDLGYEGAAAPKVVKVKKGAKVAKPADPTREGYTFEEWQLDGEEFDFETKIDKKLTLKASWSFEEANFKFVVTVPEGTEGDVYIFGNFSDNELKEEYKLAEEDGKYSIEFDLATELEVLEYKFALNNLTFVEVDAEGEEVDFRTLDVVAINSVDAEVAAWDHGGPGAVDVSFDLGYDDPAEEDLIPDAEVQKGEQAVAPNAPTRLGYEFDGWYLGEELYDFDAIVVEGLELIARWTKTHVVDFDHDYNFIIVSRTVRDGEAVEEIDAPTREGYLFQGWLLDGEEYDFDELVIEPITLVAKWAKQHVVTFDLGYDEQVMRRVALDGEKVLKPTDPVRVGHDFLGWLLDGEEFDFDTAIEAPLTLEASWEEHEKFEVTFDLDYDGADEAVVVEVYENLKAEKPADPIRVGYEFQGWYLGEEAYDFDEAVTEAILLKATWEKVDKVTVSFDTRLTGVNVAAQEVEVYDEVVTPELPAGFVKEGFRFAGWFSSKKGAFWNEPDATEFPINPNKNLTLYAAWEPVDSRAMDYGADQTYTSTMTLESRLILNPLEYQWSHETDMIDMLVAPLYSTEVDWDKAIAEGLADFAGDFSKFGVEYSIEALDYHYVLIGGAQYPVNEKGETAVVNGVFDRDLARSIRGTEWTYEIRDDLVFEDGTPINAETFNFTLRNWLDPVQNNFRANMWYKTEENANGRPLVNGFEYFTGEVSWDKVGFKVDPENPYKFTIETSEPVTLQTAVGMGNDIRLINPQKYLESIDRASGKSRYGTPDFPFSSYGSYLIKQWDENSRIVFNKNYDYVGSHLINYKSQVIRVVADVNESYNLFKSGQTSVLGLTKDHYAEYAEDENVKDSWVNYPQYMIINQAGSKLTGGNVHPTILADKRFRQALLFGLDRKYFAYNVYAPNKPTLMPIPNNAKHYLYDPTYYTDSQQHIDLIEQELGWDIEDYGFNEARAKAQFDAAYADWLAEGNTGPVTLKYVTDDADFSVSLDNYIKDSYESLFEDENGNKRLIIDINILAGTARQHAIENHDFDLVLTALGFGSALDAWWQYIAIALLPANIGASGFGLFYPNVGPAGDYEKAEYMEEEITVDFTNAFNHLSAQDPDDLLDGYKDFLDMLDEEGIYTGTVEDLAIYMTQARENPFDGGPHEPFAGASYDLDNMTAAFEKVFLDYVPLIPTVTRSSSTIYADNVVIEWPEYSEAFGWGAARYRYLNTDPDFQE